MGWAAIFQAIAQGITNLFTTVTSIKENKTQAAEIAEQAQEKADYRAKQAKYAMQQQKSSFLKGGVYFDSGTPVDVINETYDTSMEDINAISKDSVTNQKKLYRANRTALFTYLIDPVGNNGGQYANSIYQGFSNKSSSSSSSTGIKASGGFKGSNTTYA